MMHGTTNIKSLLFNEISSSSIKSYYNVKEIALNNNDLIHILYHILYSFLD